MSRLSNYEIYLQERIFALEMAVTQMASILATSNSLISSSLNEIASNIHSGGRNSSTYEQMTLTGEGLVGTALRRVLSPEEYQARVAICLPQPVAKEEMIEEQELRSWIEDHLGPHIPRPRMDSWYHGTNVAAWPTRGRLHSRGHSYSEQEQPGLYQGQLRRHESEEGLILVVDLVAPNRARVFINLTTGSVSCQIWVELEGVWAHRDTLDYVRRSDILSALAKVLEVEGYEAPAVLSASEVYRQLVAKFGEYGYPVCPIDLMSMEFIRLEIGAARWVRNADDPTDMKLIRVRWGENAELQVTRDGQHTHVKFIRRADTDNHRHYHAYRNLDYVWARVGLTARHELLAEALQTLDHYLKTLPSVEDIPA